MGDTKSATKPAESREPDLPTPPLTQFNTRARTSRQNREQAVIMGDITAIAKQFTDFYYTTFDSGRENLAALYRDHSMLTFEAEQFQGSASIIEKLKNLPFQKVQHKVSTLDAQPSSSSQASLVVLVTGQLVVDDSPNPLSYSQLFNLVPEGSSYYVFNDVFRLVYG